MNERHRLTGACADAAADILGNAPSLTGAILDRQLDGIYEIVTEATSGLTEAELTARADARRAAIIDDLVRPNGEAGRGAWEDACRRMADVVALLGEHLGRRSEPAS